VDDYTVKFTAATPSANVLSTLALMSFIVPKAARSADPAKFEANPVGSGPFKFVSRGSDGTATLEANADYFGGKPAFAKLVIKPPVEPSTAVVALQNGEVDLVQNIPPSQIPIVEGDKNLELVQQPGWSFYGLALMGPEMRDDPNLRKAIYHGIDRQKLVDVALEGIGQPANDVFNPKLMGASAEAVKDWVGYDEALAKDFLAKSNYKPGTKLTLTIMAQDAAMAQSIQDDLKKLGIDLEIEQLDVNGWSDKVMKGTAQMTTVQFGGVGESDPTSMLSLLSKTYPYLGKDMFTTDEFEALVAKIKAEPDAAKRAEMAKQAIQMQYDFANLVSLFDSVQNFANSRSVTGIDPISAATTIYYPGEFKPAQ
jgi:peptide/nickel transport system substrate-binding protein